MRVYSMDETEIVSSKTKFNKKVLLRERKRHTTRRVVSTPSVVLTGYPPHLTGYPPRGGTRTWTWPGTPPGGTRTWTWPGYPPGGVPGPPSGGYPDLDLTGYPPGGVPDWVPPGGVPGPPGGVPDQVPPRGGVPGPPLGGYPVRYPPGGGTRTWTWLGTPPGGTRPPPTASWHSGKCCKALWDMGTPPGVDRQTKWNYYLPVVLRTRAVINIRRISWCSVISALQITFPVKILRL